MNRIARSSFEYMDRVQKEIGEKYPEMRTFFSSGSMVDAILNMGMPAPIDVQVSGRHLHQSYGIAQDLASRVRQLSGVGEVYIPQDLNYPGLRLDVDRVHAGELGLTQKEIVDNVITALNSNTMIAPNYWVDYKTGNDYFLTVQYCEKGRAAIHDFDGPDQHSDSRAQSETADDTRLRRQAGECPDSHRSGSLPDSARDRCLRHAGRRRPGKGCRRSRKA